MNTHEADIEDYGPEPNMKLSHAFLVVLMLHVIAVGGLYAFNSMKAGKTTKLQVAKSNPVPEQPGQDSNRKEEKPRDPEEKPPAQQQPLVAKTSEPVATTTSRAANIHKEPLLPKPTGRNIAGSAKSLIQKVVGIGGTTTATGASSALAQSTTPASSENSAQTTPSAPKVYTVSAGDTITKISSSLGVAIPDLEKINGLASNAVLQVGQILKVPERAAAQAASSLSAGVSNVATGINKVPSAIGTAVATATGSKTPDSAQAVATSGEATAESTTYTVVKGDSPYKIAKKFKISPDELMKANGITDPKKIQIGQQLKIPVAKKAAK
jgi:LysM repeat protein